MRSVYHLMPVQSEKLAIPIQGEVNLPNLDRKASLGDETTVSFSMPSPPIH